MPRRRERQAQLEWEWSDTMRWEDLPAEERERLREDLIAILRHAARTAAESAHE